MSPRRIITLTGVVFTSVGLCLLVVAAFELLERRAFINTAIVADGHVVKTEYQRTSGGRFRGGYVTVFTFTDAAGQTHTGRTPNPQKPPSHKVGDKVIVLYQPESPETARIRSFRTMWFIPTVFGCMGLAFSIIGPFAFFTARRVYGPTDDEDSD